MAKFWSCPDGHEIRGTKEALVGVALGWPVVGKGGVLEPEYVGYTEVDWNSQRTLIDPLSGDLVWVCTEGEAFPASQLKEVDDDDEDLDSPADVDAAAAGAG